MRLTAAQAVQLARLADGGSLPKSRLSKALLHPLQEAGAVRLERSGSSYLVRGFPGKLDAFVERYWGIRDLVRYSESSPGNRSRESLAEIAGDSKALSSRPLEGLFIRSFGNCFLRGQALAATGPGSAMFISPSEFPHLEVRATTLVGIENSACLLNFEKCLPHFPGLNGDDFALILRWSWGAAWHQWIREWKGALRYFPDFDPAGLRIFASEVLPHRQDARLLFPVNLESLLKERGKRSLYLRQEFLLHYLPLHPDIAPVKEHLQRIRKALEQESLLF